MKICQEQAVTKVTTHKQLVALGSPDSGQR